MRLVVAGRASRGRSARYLILAGKLGGVIWGDDDYEFGVLEPSASLPKLAFELLREKFSGQFGAVDAFRDWCRTRGIQHEVGSWI